jgi:hypothetical protein
LGREILVLRLDDGTFQPHADQLQHRAVGNPSLQTLNQRIMRNRIKVRFQIRVVDFPKPGGNVLASVAQVVADFTPKPGRCSRISLVFGSENGLGAM